MLFMTVPTAGKHPELLDALIRDSGLPLNQIVIVVTKPGVALPDGVIRVEDFESMNIQRWWNAGIDEAQQRGANVVAVLNDDMWLAPHSLVELRDELVRTGATIASPSRPGEREGLHKGRLVPYSPKLWGCFWLLDLDSGLRPDDKYVWWYGDHDLDIRARRDFGGVVTKSVDYEHLYPGEGTGASAALLAQTHKDAEIYHTEYARLHTLTRWSTAPKRWAKSIAWSRKTP